MNLLDQILARSLLEPDLATLGLDSWLLKSTGGKLLEPDLATLGLASWLLKFASGNLGKGPAGYGNLLLETLGMGPLGPNPSQKPFGARFGDLGACQLAIEICFWKPWE